MCSMIDPVKKDRYSQVIVIQNIVIARFDCIEITATSTIGTISQDDQVKYAIEGMVELACRRAMYGHSTYRKSSSL